MSVEVTELRPGLALVRLARPDSLNTLNHELVRDFHAALDRLEHDHETRVVVRTGAGRAFCAGFALNGYGDSDDLSAHRTGHRRRPGRGTARSRRGGGRRDPARTAGADRMTRRGLWAGVESPSPSPAQTMALENRMQVLTALTEDQPEAGRAYRRKRPPSYRRR